MVQGFESEHRTKAGLVGRPMITESRTIGWQPTCTCNAGDPVPCVTIDIFGGSGTVAAVARRLGRRSVLIELNEKYARENIVPRFDQGILFA